MPFDPGAATYFTDSRRQDFAKAIPVLTGHAANDALWETCRELLNVDWSLFCDAQGWVLARAIQRQRPDPAVLLTWVLQIDTCLIHGCWLENYERQVVLAKFHMLVALQDAVKTRVKQVQAACAEGRARLADLDQLRVCLLDAWVAERQL